MWATFFQSKRCALITTKNGLGYILGDFFTNSSGHTDPKRFSKVCINSFVAWKLLKLYNLTFNFVRFCVIFFSALKA
jgi:hypothetical protein